MRTTRRLLLTTVGVTALVAAGITPALAVPPGDARVQTLAAADSDTTQDVMGAVLSAYQGDANPDSDVIVNIPVRPAASVDIARSSSGRTAADPATFEYYGFAKDAVSWAHFPGAAPADRRI